VTHDERQESATTMETTADTRTESEPVENEEEEPVKGIFENNESNDREKNEEDCHNIAVMEY